MRRIQKILFGTFLGGVLLCGVGAGTALVEYSSFTYAGEKKIGWEVWRRRIWIFHLTGKKAA